MPIPDGDEMAELAGSGEYADDAFAQDVADAEDARTRVRAGRRKR